MPTSHPFALLAHPCDTLSRHFLLPDPTSRVLSTGPFWYKEAALQPYGNHPLRRGQEQDTISSVLCTPEMTYATMAATMYTIREVLSAPQHELFERLTSEGVAVLKHARTGRAQRKLFQLSLVQGDMYLYMYLTWKGKQGTQGVELASVEDVAAGLRNQLLSLSAKGLERCVSLRLPERSLDLEFDTARDAGLFLQLVSELVRLERQVRKAEGAEGHGNGAGHEKEGAQEEARQEPTGVGASAAAVPRPPVECGGER